MLKYTPTAKNLQDTYLTRDRMIAEFPFIIFDLRTRLRWEKCFINFDCPGICFAEKTRRPYRTGS
jgi:hypothetical protein